MTDAEQSPSEILARRNVQNIAVKLKAGKTLTTSERKALNDFQTGQLDGWVKDLSTLAKELGLSRQAIYDARNRFPDDYQAKTDKIGKYMIGMSVPPKMTEVVARAVIDQWLQPT